MDERNVLDVLRTRLHLFGRWYPEIIDAHYTSFAQQAFDTNCVEELLQPGMAAISAEAAVVQLAVGFMNLFEVLLLHEWAGRDRPEQMHSIMRLVCYNAAAEYPRQAPSAQDRTGQDHHAFLKLASMALLHFKSFTSPASFSTQCSGLNSRGLADIHIMIRCLFLKCWQTIGCMYYVVLAAPAA
jgi:hypothetical protein